MSSAPEWSCAGTRETQQDTATWRPLVHLLQVLLYCNFRFRTRTLGLTTKIFAATLPAIGRLIICTRHVKQCHYNNYLYS